MRGWWKQFRDQLPLLNEEQKEHIEEITGCIPLHLRGLLGSQDMSFEKALHKLMGSTEVHNVERQLNNFHSGKKIE